MTKYTSNAGPKAVGYWVVSGSIPSMEMRFMMCQRPSWLHRTFMRVLLGWTWRDQA